MAENQNVGVLEQINSQYYELTNSERKIADFVLQNVDKVQFMSITELATACAVSDATVSRFCRSLNQDSYNIFKMKLAHDIAYQDNFSQNNMYGQRGFAKKISRLVQNAMGETLGFIDESELNEAVKLLEKANRVLCVGNGGSNVMAGYIVQRFSMICGKFREISENHAQYYELAAMTENDVLILISYSGATKEVVDIMAQANSRGVKTILLTHFPQSPASKYADLVLRTGTYEDSLEYCGVPAYVTVMVVGDMLFKIYYDRNKKQCAAHRERINAIIASHNN